MMNNVSTSALIKALNKKGYALFENDAKPYNLNIVGIRNSNPKPNVFNDLMAVFWKYQGRWNMVQMDFTSEAGLHWLENPLSAKGTAILKEGQYRGCWQLSLHQGKYKALCQRKPVTVIRDNNKDDKYDYDAPTEEGLFGINIHRANSKTESTQVDKWSAGCQVIQSPHEYDVFIKMCEEATEVFSNSFTYTLINENDL